MGKETNLLHGMTLEKILLVLVEHYGWNQLAHKININCFTYEPSVKSCLKFLRKLDHEWARIKVERLYMDYIQKSIKQEK